jgi:L-malate glycosyltransferase
MPILNPPLRVMHIISGDLWAGAEVQAFTLLQQLHASAQLHVIVMNSGELSQRLEALGISITLVPESKLSSLSIIREIMAKIRYFKPDILHTHRQKENIFGNIASSLAAILTGKRAKSVRTSHGAPEFVPAGKQRIQVWLDNWTGRYLQHAVIAVSKELALKLAKIFPAKKIHVIRNGVNQAALAAQAVEADFRTRAPHHKHIGIVGRLEPVKRIDIFVDMAALLLQQEASRLLQQEASRQELKFHIIGDGKLRATMEAKAQELGLSEHIQFHGHRQDMASCIHSLDLLIMCSDHEGTPMTALESLALGTPLIAHNTGGLTDILQQYPELLVAKHNPAGYAETVIQLLSRSKLNIALNDNYTAEKNMFETLKLYENLMGAHYEHQ